jgi:CheY-like chemotaxis protein
MLSDADVEPRSPLVLLVHEDDGARETLRRALECVGILVVEARVAPEALATLRETPPDVIAVDVAPGIGGLGVCHRLREQSHAERIPIIAFLEASSSSSGDDREPATDTSVVVLGRPCPPETLIGEIRRLLAPFRQTAKTPRPTCQDAQLDE